MAGRQCAAVGLGVALLAGAWAVPSERVLFKNGSPTAKVRGRLFGPDRGNRDYIVPGKAGEILSVELMTDYPQVYYSVLPPADAKPLINTSITGPREWSGALPLDGDYRVRVFLSRRAAREGVIAPFKMRLTRR